MTDMNKVIANRVKRRLAAIGCEAKIDAAGVYQVYWHGKQTEFIYVDINTLYDELNEIVTSIQALSNDDNIDVFWREIQRNIKMIKALPDSVVISIGDGLHDNYGNINNADMHCDDSKAWITLSKRHTLTIFEKSDYIVLNSGQGKDLAATAKSEIEHVFSFSKAITYDQLFGGNGQWN